MQLYGTPVQNLKATLERMEEGLEKIKEGVNLLKEYDLLLVLEGTDDITREEIINAIEDVKDGLSLITEE